MLQRRLIPGLAVEVPPSDLPDALPRMDVALFVGFAERGPVHRPVAVDSADAYAAVFGGDVVLARDKVAGRDLYAALPSCVRSFFSNGGSRAWIVRVCRTEALERGWHGTGAAMADVAVARTFTFADIGADGQPLIVRAASLGGWADQMRLCVRADLSRGKPRLRFRAEIDGEFAEMGPFGTDPADPDSWWAQLDDDLFYASTGAVAGARAPLAATGAPAPIDLSLIDEFWSAPVGPDPEPGDRLAHDGLSRFGADLFLDPALAALGVDFLADAVRARAQEDVAPLGIHALLAVPGGTDFAEPSMIAVPDAAQPGWSLMSPAAVMGADFARPVDTPFAIPPAWRDHNGSCAVPPPAEGMTGPDTARFLDCATRALATPVFAPVASPVPVGVAMLNWTASEPGAVYVLEAAGRADLGGAVEIWRGDDLSQLVELAHEGPYYYRIHAELGENISDSSVVGLFAADSDFAATQPDDYDAAPLLAVQAALLRLAQALGDQFALLGLPAHYGAAAAAAHREALLAALGPAGHALSYAALYHPWLVTARGETGPGDLLAVPPEGAVAATMARRARERGAWIAPARQPLSGIVALAPAIPDSAREGIATGRVNLLRHDPHGFMASDALTLSDEVDWDEINVRRLMSFLRRMAVREGQVFVFEPNGDVLRRSIERRFGQMLDALVARGAFAGKGAADSYRLLVTTTDQDRMNGRLAVEIAVAPSQPLRFLTLVLARVGERFSVGQER